MTTRSPRINPLLAAVGVLLLLALSVSLAHSETGSSTPDHDPDRGGFHIQGTDLGVFLVDSRTGDTWKWYVDRSASGDITGMGWQHHAIPVPIGGNTLQEQAELIARQRELIDTQERTIKGQQALVLSAEKRIQQLEAGCP